MRFARPLSGLTTAVLVASVAVALLAPVGASAAPGDTTRAAADASPSPSASLIPTGCPDSTDGRVSLETIIATGPAKMIECMDASGAYALEFDAYFPSFVCDGCGGVGGGSITPSWLSGGLVDYDPQTGVVTSALGLQPEGMRVETGPEPALIGDDAATAWFDANVLDLRLPPGIGKCNTADTSAALGCTIGRYANQTLHFRAHYQDPAAATCTASERLDGSTIPAAAVKTYCEQQLVVDSFVVTAPRFCPTQPYTIGQLSHFTDDRLVACLGSRTIAITAYVPAESGGRGSLWGGTPAWLVQEWGTGMNLANGTADGASWRLVRIPPKLGACDTSATFPASCPFRRFAGKWVKIVGHFADPLSATCKATWTSPAPKDAYFTPDYIRQYCREQFVISARPVAAKAPKNP